MICSALFLQCWRKVKRSYPCFFLPRRWVFLQDGGLQLLSGKLTAFCICGVRPSHFVRTHLDTSMYWYTPIFLFVDIHQYTALFKARLSKYNPTNWRGSSSFSQTWLGQCLGFYQNHHRTGATHIVRACMCVCMHTCMHACMHASMHGERTVCYGSQKDLQSMSSLQTDPQNQPCDSLQMKGPNPAKSSNCMSRFLYDSDSILESSILLLFQNGKVQVGSLQTGLWNGPRPDPLQISTCYKMEGFVPTKWPRECGFIGASRPPISCGKF